MLTLIGFSIYKGTFVDNSNLTWPLLCAFFLLFCVAGEKLLLERQNSDLLEPDFLFFVIFFVFHFSYIAIFVLGLSTYNKEVFFNPDTVPRALFFCIFCLLAFLAGYGKPFGIPQKMRSKDSRYILERAFLFSKILLILCLLFFWVPLLVLGREVFLDYALLIDVGAASYLGKLFWLEQYLGVAALSLFCISSGILHRKFMSGPFKYAAAFYILSFLIIGDRGGFVYMAIIPLIAYNIFQKRISGKIFAAILLTFLLIIPIVAFSRTKSIFNPLQMVRTYSADSSESLLVSSLNELGTTIKTVAITMHFVPDRYEYWWGSSYLYSLSLVLPNIQGMRSSVGTPGAWLTETAFGDLSKTHGRGGSIAMEAYRNFGYALGLGVFLLLGFGLKKVYGLFLRQTSILSGVAYFSIVASIVLWVRNDSALAPRTIIWSMLITFVFSMIVHMTQKQKLGFKRAR
jgi:oligosaccharide repeat unit polymerase